VSDEALNRSGGEGDVARRAAQATLWVIVVGTILRVVAGASVGLGIGESYYFAAARHLSLSYFDQPPAAAFLAGLALRLTGTVNGLVLRAPFILLFGGTTWLMFVAGRRLFGPWQGFWAALLLNLAPVFALSTGVFFQPEGPLMFCWLGCLACLAPVVVGTPAPVRPLRSWALAGLLLGLALLSKYPALFLPAGTALYLLLQRDRWRRLAEPGPWLAVAVAAACFTPVLLWNAQHHWVSFLWQGSRGTVWRGLHLDWLVHNLSGQAVELLPWIWLLLLVEPFRALRGAGEELPARRFLVCVGLPPILAFTAVSAYAPIGNHFHWGTPGYLTLLLGLGATVHRWFSRGGPAARATIGVLAAASLAFMAMVNVQAVTGRFTEGFGGLSRWLSDGNDATVELIDYTALEERFRQEGWLDRKDLFVFSDRWYAGGKIDYALRGRMPFLLLNGADPRQYAFFDSPDRWVGQEGILVVNREADADIAHDFGPYCSRLEPLEPVEIVRAGRVEATLRLYRCARLVKSFPLPYR
jgi:hypothetical protein